MKILGPISSSFDLVVSAAAAVVIHAVVLGFGMGSVSEAPVPQIRNVDRCETVTFMSKPTHLRREPEEPLRERAEAERYRTPSAFEPVSRTLKESPPRTLPPKPPEKVPDHSKVSRNPRESPRRELVDQPDLPMVEGPLERLQKPPDADGRQEIALSRSAAPAVDKGFAFTYPRIARVHGYQGRAHLLVTVSPEGRVVAVEVHSTSGHRILDMSAASQMKEVPFHPALDEQGLPIPATVAQTVCFEIKGTDAKAGLN